MWEAIMNEILELYKVLGDETRIRIINLVYRQNLCVCELVEILELSQPKISKHIAKLRQIKLLHSERNEQYVYYSFNKSNESFASIISNTLEVLKDSDVLISDLNKLNNVESFVCSR